MSCPTGDRYCRQNSATAPIAGTVPAMIYLSAPDPDPKTAPKPAPDDTSTPA